MHLYAIYMIFGTNLLTRAQCQFLFFPCFLVSQKRKTKQSPIDLKIHGDYFWTRRSPRSIRDGPEESRGTHKGGGVPYPPGRAPYLVATSETPLTCSRCQNLLYIQKPLEHNLDREFRRRKLQ